MKYRLHAVVNFEAFPSEHNHCSRNGFNARFTKLSPMNAGWKNSSLIPKKVAKLAEKSNSSDAVCRLWGISFKVTVGDFGIKIIIFRTKIYYDPSKWSWQNSSSRSFENTSWCWSGSTRWKTFPCLDEVSRTVCCHRYANLRRSWLMV